MAQLKTYSRKSRQTHTIDGAYKSSQESFFDSPDDPYFFDSQSSSFEPSPQSISTRPLDQYPASSLDLSASNSLYSHSQSCPEVVEEAATVATMIPLPATLTSKLQASAPVLTNTAVPQGTQSKDVPPRPLSRLSRSSSQGTESRPNILLSNSKRSSTNANSLERSVAKKARMTRPSGSSVNQSIGSGSKIVADKQKLAPATTVLEVMIFLGQGASFFFPSLTGSPSASACVL